MLPKILAVLLLLGVALYFLVSAEDGAAVSLFDWLRDPAGSRVEHSAQVARDRELTALAPVGEPDGLLEFDGLEPVQDDLPAQGPLEPESDEAARALLGVAGEDDLEALLSASAVTLRGLTVAPDGAPWAGVKLGALQPGGSEQLSQSDASGAFELELRGAGGTLALDDAAWVLLAGELGLAPGLNVGGGVRVLVLAPRADLSGRVLDEAGRPLSDVAVRVERTYEDAPAALRELLPPRFELQARSDAEGRWELAPLPDLPGLRVRFEAEGRAALERGVTELREDGAVTLPAD